MTTVYLLFHQNPEADDDGKLLGVYSTLERAQARQVDAARLPGFRRFPDEFVIDPYDVDEDQWTEGFVTYLEDGTWVEDPQPRP